MNEGIRTMALMEFMKLLEPTQLMEGLIYIHGADLSDGRVAFFAREIKSRPFFFIFQIKMEPPN